MKVNEILTEKAVKMKPADAWAHVEKVKSMLAKGQMTQQQLDGAIKQANSIEDSYWKSKAQKLDAKWEGAEWWELAKKMYPIVQTDDGWKVTSTAKGWKDEKSWTLQYKAQAMEKVQRLVKWLDQNRKRGFGDKDEDVARLAAKFAAEDKKEPEEVHEGKDSMEGYYIIKRDDEAGPYKTKEKAIADGGKPSQIKYGVVTRSGFNKLQEPKSKT